jgi:hypothetical protein
VAILSINPIDMSGRVEADAQHFELPFTILVGRDSDVISDYQIVKLPRIIIIRKDGNIAFTERFAPYDLLKAELVRVLAAQKEKPPQKDARPQKETPRQKKPRKK